MESLSDKKGIRHIAIIMDGNGRWADRHGVEKTEGHRMGAEAVRTLIKNAADLSIEYITLYAFSTENWKRSKEEVDALMELLCEFIDSNIDEINARNIRLLASGRIGQLPEKSKEKLLFAVESSSKNTGGTLVLALNYGGRAEIADAAKKIASDALKGFIKTDDIDENLFSKYLYLPEVPDPDLLIRTSGEMRLSNFLLWELSYSEIYVTETLWPDFDKNELEKAIDSFKGRKRRYGGR